MQKVSTRRAAQRGQGTSLVSRHTAVSRTARRNQVIAEALETRRLLSTYQVSTTADSAGTVTTAGHAGTQNDPYVATTLRAAITAANSNAGADNITFNPATFGSAQTIRLTSMLPIITEDVTITGPGKSLLTINGDANNSGTVDGGDVRLLFINQGTVNISDLTLSGGYAKGGDGGSGGLGAGGAIFINGLYNGSEVATNVTLTHVRFSADEAVGGSPTQIYGGGGGLSGNAVTYSGGGGFAGNSGYPFGRGYTGGGGFSGSGVDQNGGSGAGSPFGGAAAQSGGSTSNGIAGSPGGGVGGGGGYGGDDPNADSDTSTGGKGGDGGIGGGGGAGGSGGRIGGDGGNGGDFGGGGAAGFRENDESDDSRAGNGGNGGFGGGGGGNGHDGGNGGFGGGGGDGDDTAGKGGFGGGDAGYPFGGGGGAGLGGAIFIRSGSLTLNNDTFDSNTATGGTIPSGGRGQPGQGIGGAIFAVTPALASQAGVTSAPTLNFNNLTFTSNTASTSNNDIYPAAEAPSLVVNTTNDVVNAYDNLTSLREAVAYANTFPAQQVITFDPSLAGKTIKLSIDGDDTYGPSALPITGQVIIQGLGGNSGVTIARDTTAAPNRLRLFYVAPGGALSLQNLTITGGLAAGGNSQGGGAGAGLGGAIVDAGTLTVISCTFTNNKAVGGTSTTGTFSTGGGGGLGGDASGENGGPPNGGTAHGDLSDPGGFGGGGGSNLVSSAGGFGGGGGAGSNGPAGAGGFGGGGGGENSGTAANGGFGAGNGNGAVGGGGAGMGGAIFSNGGTIKIINSTFTANAAAGGKGGTNGQGLGGAVFNRDGTLTITNSTMSADNAVDGGLEVYSFSDSDHSGGDPVTGKVATTSINNSILAQALDPDGDSVIPDLAVSTKGSGQTNTALNSDLFNGSNLSLPASELTRDPMLGGLANNGGPTMTMALQPGSPAIDKGDTTLAKYGEPLAFDQRGSGFARVMGTSVDIGAFEVQVPAVVTSVGSTTAHGTFGVGGTVAIIVGFNEIVNVTGTPQLALNSGGTASYVSGSGTSNLTFSYTVGAGQNSSDLDEASTTALTLNGGTINDAAGKAATLTLPAPGAAGSLGANESIVIDTTAPTVTNISSTTADGDYPAGSVIAVTVAFSEPVNVTGTPSIDLNDGGEAFYASGSGTSTLTFDYTVSSGENTGKLDEASGNALVLGGGVSIADAAGNAANVTIPDSGSAGSLGANKSIQIDTKLPTVTDFEPDTTDGTVGTPVIYTITFSEPVSGLDLNSLDNTGTAAISVDSVTPDSAPNTYKVSVTPTGPGTIQLEINGLADIRDDANNSLVVPVVDTHVVNVPVPNSAPTDIQLSPNSIPENAGAGKVVGTLSDTDPDANDTATYTLVSGPGSSGNFAFAIVNNQLVARTSFNYELVRSLPILVQVTDSGGLSLTEQLTVNVLNVNEAPTASNDSASTTPDKAVTIDVLSNDSDVDGDKLSPVSNTKPANGSVTVSGNKFIYTPKTGFHGVDTFTYIVSDGHGLTDKATVTITVGSGVGVGKDPVDSSITDLDIVGTSSADAIKVVYSGSQGKVQVFFGNTNEGTFNFTGRILVYGQGGNDTVTIDPKITRTSIIWGDAGNDSITGGGGNDVLLGGSGDDKLNGGDGRDILLGDDGRDSLNGGGGDDILIAGNASAEGNLSAIAAWNHEWSRMDKNYSTRVTDITTGKGYASGFALNSNTANSSANPPDTLTGSSGQDLFLANTTPVRGVADLITDRVKTGSSAETLVAVTS